MLAAILTSAGYKTALYTSPHLINFSERIRIDRRTISEKRIESYTRMLRPFIERERATFFEATTAIAFQYFADEQVDVAVLETGLGGRLDATNVVTPILSAITSISLEHTEILGNSTMAIAREKGGIIKKRIPCVVGKVGPKELRVLRNIANGLDAPLYPIEKEVQTSIQNQTLFGLNVNVETPERAYRNIRLSFTGEHQVENLSIVIRCFELLRDAGLTRLTEKALRGGLQDIRCLTGLRGRLEVKSKDPFVLVDVAHNSDAAYRLVRSISKLHGGKIVTVFGIMADKNVEGIARELAKISRITIAVRPQTPRALDEASIVRAFHKIGSKCVIGGDVWSGFSRALKTVRPDEAILVTGSHYVVGEVLVSSGT